MKDLSKEYQKGDKITIQGDAFTMYGVSSIVSVQDDNSDLSLDEILQEYDGRKVKVTIEFLD